MRLHTSVQRKVHVHDVRSSGIPSDSSAPKKIDNVGHSGKSSRATHTQSSLIDVVKTISFAFRHRTRDTIYKIAIPYK